MSTRKSGRTSSRSRRRSHSGCALERRVLGADALRDAEHGPVGVEVPDAPVGVEHRRQLEADEPVGALRRPARRRARTSAVALRREQHRRAAERLHRLDVGLVERARHEVDAERPRAAQHLGPLLGASSRCTNPVSMFTAGVSPASAVRVTCASKAAQSTSIDERCGSRIADIPTIDRPGRSRSSGRRHPSAWSRSARRSSTSSMPMLRRTRSAGTSLGVPATEAWVMRPGCSMRLSTAPRLSARVNSSVRRHSSSAAASPPASADRHHPAERRHLPGRHVVAGVGGQPRVEHLGDRRVVDEALGDGQRRSRCGAPCAAAGCARRGARGSSRAGPGTAPAAFWRKPMRSASSSSSVADEAADHVAVAAEVLGGGVHDDVGAERERLLERRGGEGVVDDDQRVRARGRAR